MNYVDPAQPATVGTYQGWVYGVPWPTTREGRAAAFAARWRAYRQEPYTEQEICTLALFVASNTDEQRTAVTQRVLPDYAFVCDVNAAAIATDGVTLLAKLGDDAALEAGRAVWTASGIDARLPTWARNECVDGVGYLEDVLRPDGQVVIVWHQPSCCEVQMDRTGTVVTQAIITIVEQPAAVVDPDGTLQTGGEPVEYRRVITPTDVQVWRGGVRVAEESGANPLGRVPVVRVAYADVADGAMPMNPARGLDAGLAFANSALTQIQTVGSRQANPILAIIGAQLADGASLQKQGKSVSLPTGADLRWVELGLDGLRALNETIGGLITMTRATYPEWLFVDASANSSGTALGYRASAFVDKVRPGRQSMYLGLADAVAMAVVMKAGRAWTPEDARYTVDGGSALSLDVGAAMDLRMRMADAGYMLREDVVAYGQASRLLPQGMDTQEYAARAMVQARAATEDLTEAVRLLSELQAAGTLAEVASAVESPDRSAPESPDTIDETPSSG